jgi:hypothetical protein
MQIIPQLNVGFLIVHPADGIAVVRALVNPPRVKASPCALECKWLKTLRLDDLDGNPSPRFIAFGQVIGIYVDERFIRDGLVDTDEMVTAQMSLAKGLEFRAVVVTACDQGILPLDERVADEAELDDIYETERRLLYVACTRTSAADGGCTGFRKFSRFQSKVRAGPGNLHRTISGVSA